MKATWTGVTLLLTVTCFTTGARAIYVEDWNDPAKQANGWVESDINDVPAVAWSATGGQDGGYIFTNLTQLDDWGHWANTSGYGTGFAEHDYYPAWIYQWPSSFQPGVDQTLKVAIRDLSAASPLNLAGGQLQLWIGDEPAEGVYTYFAFNTPLLIGNGDWTDNTLTLTTDPADWTLIGDSQGKTVTDLLAGPVAEFGFRIIGGMSDPQGILGFDNFMLVPEPAGISLWVLVAVGLTARRRGETK